MSNKRASRKTAYYSTNYNTRTVMHFYISCMLNPLTIKRLSVHMILTQLHSHLWAETQSGNKDHCHNTFWLYFLMYMPMVEKSLKQEMNILYESCWKLQNKDSNIGQWKWMSTSVAASTFITRKIWTFFLFNIHLFSLSLLLLGLP